MEGEDLSAAEVLRLQETSAPHQVPIRLDVRPRPAGDAADVAKDVDRPGLRAGHGDLGEGVGDEVAPDTDVPVRSFRLDRVVPALRNGVAVDVGVDGWEAGGGRMVIEAADTVVEIMGVIRVDAVVPEDVVSLGVEETDCLRALRMVGIIREIGTRFLPTVRVRSRMMKAVPLDDDAFDGVGKVREDSGVHVHAKSVPRIDPTPSRDIVLLDDDIVHVAQEADRVDARPLEGEPPDDHVRRVVDDDVVVLAVGHVDGGAARGRRVQTVRARGTRLSNGECGARAGDRHCRAHRERLAPGVSVQARRGCRAPGKVQLDLVRGPWLQLDEAALVLAVRADPAVEPERIARLPGLVRVDPPVLDVALTRRGTAGGRPIETDGMERRNRRRAADRLDLRRSTVQCRAG